MNLPRRLHPRLWLLAPVCAFVFLAWTTYDRVRRVEYVSNLAGNLVPGPLDTWRASARSVPGGHDLIVPERNEASYEWMMQTRNRLAAHSTRLSYADYDNAPWGREVRAPSPYRWWLASLTLIDKKISGDSLNFSLQRVALYAEPALHVVMLVFVTAFVAWRFGSLAAALFSVGLVTLFPFAAGFLPGVPDHHGWARMCGLVSGLFLAGAMGAQRESRWLVGAGAIAALGLWFDVPTTVPLLAGTALGGVFAAVAIRRHRDANALLQEGTWRRWALGGASTIAAAYLLEYAPGGLGDWHLEFIHPLYGIAWLGLGELLEIAATWSRREKFSWNGTLLRMVLAIVALASVPAVMNWFGNPGYLMRDLFSVRLSNQPGGIVAASFWSWVSRDGLSVALVATVLPLALVVPACCRLLSTGPAWLQSIRVALGLGPVVIALVLAVQQLSWWATLGGYLLVFLVACTARHAGEPAGLRPWRWVALISVLAILGAVALWPQSRIDSSMTLTAAETEELVERDLAHWLARRAGEPGAVVFAPPHSTLSLGFYGGLRGIGTFSSENTMGFAAALMLTGARTMEEVQAQIQARQVRYIVIPSWDPFFEEFARLYLTAKFATRKSFLVGELKRWNLPLWLRPLAYSMPMIPGFEQQSVLVFEVVEDQKPPVAAGRLTEYLIEIGELEQAAKLDETLRRFPGDVAALVARAQIGQAKDLPADFAENIERLAGRLAAGGDRYLAWDRRVALAVCLAQGNRVDQAREQTRRCIVELDASKLRTLSVGSLYRLLVLCAEFHLVIPDDKLRAEAFDELPAELRHRL